MGASQTVRRRGQSRAAAGTLALSHTSTRRRALPQQRTLFERACLRERWGVRRARTAQIGVVGTAIDPDEVPPAAGVDVQLAGVRPHRSLGIEAPAVPGIEVS